MTRRASSTGVLMWKLTMPSVVVSKGDEEICEKCSLVPGTEDVVAYAPGFSLCECEDGSELTAVSGTWRLKYLATQSSKWKKAASDTSITTIYSFPSYVVSYLNSL